MNVLAKLAPSAITKVAGRQLLVAQKASPTALFVGGVVGVVATTVLASRATLKVEDVLERAEKDIDRIKKVNEAIPDDKYDDTDAKKDMAIVYSRAAVDIVKLYGPAVAVGIVSVAALTGSHVILTRRNAALTAAYAALDKGFREYRRRVVEDLGEDADRKYRYSTDLASTRDKKKVDGDEDDLIYKMDPNKYSIYARFFDEMSTSWQRDPEYNYTFLKCQQSFANDLLHARGHVFLNEIYDRLGIPRSKEGAVVGWVLNSGGDNYVDFGIFDGYKPKVRDFVNGREAAILLDFNVDGIIYDKI